MRRRLVLGKELEAVQQRHTERERLAGTGACLADEVGTTQRQWNRERLDREGLDDAHIRQRLGDRLGDAEILECIL